MNNIGKRQFYGNLYGNLYGSFSPKGNKAGIAEIRACLISRFRPFFERFSARQGKPNLGGLPLANWAKPTFATRKRWAKSELLLGGLDADLAENKPEKGRNGDVKQALRRFKKTNARLDRTTVS